MANYVLASSWDRANIQDRLWYCQTEQDRAELTTNETILFGDKVWVIESQTLYIMGRNSSGEPAWSLM